MQEFDFKQMFYDLEDEQDIELEVVHTQNEAEYDSYGNADYEIFYVVKMPDESLMKLRGRYQSYNGTDFIEAVPCKLTEKTIQVYE